MDSRARHRLAHHDDWPWLPTSDRGILVRHAWCEDCGVVRAAGARGLDLGGLMNLLGRLERRLRQEGVRVTEAQRRLIVRTIRAREADDTFGITRERQIEAVSRIAAHHLHVHPDTIEAYLRSC